MFAVLLRTALIYALVIFCMRLMGKRQLGELQPSELASTFLVSNLASICIEDPDLPLLSSLAPVLLVAALEIWNSLLCYHFSAYARLIYGKPVTVIRQGQIDQKALKALRMSVGDLLEALRVKDCFDPQDIDWGQVETDGSLSLSLHETAQGDPLLPVVVDGSVLTENLIFLKKDMRWLEALLQKNGTALPQVAFLLASQSKAYLTIQQEGSP